MPPMSSADAFANLDEFEDERKEIQRENNAHIRRMEHERLMRDNAQGSKKATATAGGGRTAIATVTCDAITLKLTLKSKLLERPFETALIKPFLGAFNKKRPDQPDGLGGLTYRTHTTVSKVINIINIAMSIFQFYQNFKNSHDISLAEHTKIIVTIKLKA